MKAIDRCKETLNGERCKKARFHDFETNQNPDEVHQGDFSAWKGKGDKVTVLAKAKGAVPCIRKSALRQVDKLLRLADRHAAVGGEHTKTAKAIIEFVEKGLKRG